MLVNTNEMLRKAQREKYAVGAFNVENMEMVQALIKVANKMESPIILATSVSTLKYANPDIFRAITEACTQNCSVPVAIHLDHGRDLKNVITSVKAGYKSVMFDGSLLAFRENVEKTMQIVELCKVFDISVEGELGAISGKKGEPSVEDIILTEPYTAKDFVELTRVDSLAVAIGTCHGIYRSKPNLDYPRLKKIAEIVDVPLVLHGASGLSDEELQRCIQNGICKINMATDLRMAYTNTVRTYIQSNTECIDPKEFGYEAMQSVEKIVEERIKIMGCAGKA